jgi:exonuclease III
MAITRLIKIIIQIPNLKEVHNNDDPYSINGNFVYNKKDDFRNQFRVFHQNIRGLNDKIEELMISLHNQLPNIICLTKHHMIDYKIDALHIPQYKLGAKYCIRNLKNGGVCIYIQEDLKFSTINLHKYCKQQDLEIVDIQIKINKNKLIIFGIYTAPTGNFEYFLKKLDHILNSYYRHNLEFIICGDINVNYLETSSKKTQLVDMLNTYNLRGTVCFPTRIVNN